MKGNDWSWQICYYFLLDSHTTVHFSNHSAETFLENCIKSIKFPPKLNKTNMNTESVSWHRCFKLEFKTRFFVFIIIDTLFITYLHTTMILCSHKHTHTERAMKQATSWKENSTLSKGWQCSKYWIQKQQVPKLCQDIYLKVATDHLPKQNLNYSNLHSCFHMMVQRNIIPEIT